MLATQRILPFMLLIPLAASASATERPVQSRETLRQCNALDREIGQLRSSVKSERLLLELAEQEFTSIDSLVKALRSTLDRSDASELESFNARVAEQNRALEAYQARRASYTQVADTLDAGIERFNTECLGEYFEDDMRAVQAEREAALRAEIDARNASERQGRPVD